MKPFKIYPNWLSNASLAILLADLGDNQPDDARVDMLYSAISDELTRRVGEDITDYMLDAASASVTYGAILLDGWIKEYRQMQAELNQAFPQVQL